MPWLEEGHLCYPAGRQEGCWPWDQPPLPWKKHPWSWEWHP